MFNAHAMLNTTHEWIEKLASTSNIIAQMQLKTDIKNNHLNTDAAPLANCASHCQLIGRAIDELIINNFATDDTARDVLRNLIQRNTLGAFAELAAYDWFTRCHVRISTQVPMTSSEVLSPNGTVLDGKVEHYGIYFDVKSFGFNGLLARRLKQRIQAEIIDEQVHIEESWDISYDTFSKLIEDAKSIAERLKRERVVKLGKLLIRIEPKQLVSVSPRTIDPYLLAKENALYPFKFAKQFTKNDPFILVFIIHPWFNQNSMGIDFAGVDTQFTRSLARRAFMQFKSDASPVNSVCENIPSDVSLADASSLLSAIFFVNVWPNSGNNNDNSMPSWLYTNPRAKHPISSSLLHCFYADKSNNIHIDDFSNDNY